MGAEADVRMPLTAHLEELRTRIIRSLLGIAAGFLASYGFSEWLVAWLLKPLIAIRPDQALVIGTGVTDAFFTKLKVAAVAGVFVASPIVFYQAWQFVAPGLYERERRVALPFSAAATFFFVSGAAFCYYLVFPVAFRFFLDEFTSVGISPQIRVSEYLTFTSRMLLAFGVTFELPVVTFFLARIGLVTHRMMIAGARYAIVVIFIVAAVLTPGPDVASQMLMATPLLVLYALSIGIAYMVGRPAAETSDETEPEVPAT
ncbi:MAG TPA: twin-arginine translocase subunit TatC [Candidatus Binatia bacterium]|jgi:sec-independent protein translocase protein TatC|nr:twin-arginine translocase subunit TatC [Candidatus Binatia bacterium]